MYQYVPRQTGRLHVRVEAVTTDQSPEAHHIQENR
ncbi:hypothetical protein A8926_5831 [Saccharopolyspora spinosa]|uniref:Uncharacterized protein n=1 Tax=Saccharopolyspora spinosa TaxID=60894 RepID=A0A2N3Y4K3_SACSN|nr:hypothetical protein A8926_5831 [Saccharopolyspora spinosa]